MKSPQAFKIWFLFYMRWLKNSDFHSSYLPLEGLNALIKWTSNRTANLQNFLVSYSFISVPSRAWEMPLDLSAAWSISVIFPSEPCCFCLCGEELQLPISGPWTPLPCGPLCGALSLPAAELLRERRPALPTKGQGDSSLQSLDSKGLLQALEPCLGDSWTMV